MRTFRLLEADEIECRISEIEKQGRYVSLLLYKTARTDAKLLDETVGADRWQNDYKSIDGKMYCGIGILFNGNWVWKWNCGTESNTEAEKGEASDALKRAGFVWGIGTELYSAPRIYVNPDRCTIKENNGKQRCYDRFSVREIKYDDAGDITALTIWNDSRNALAWCLGEKPEKKSEPPKSEPKGEPMAYCAECGKPIYTTREGAKYNGDILCLDCIRLKGETWKKSL